MLKWVKNLDSALIFTLESNRIFTQFLVVREKIKIVEKGVFFTKSKNRYLTKNGLKIDFFLQKVSETHFFIFYLN